MTGLVKLKIIVGRKKFEIKGIVKIGSNLKLNARIKSKLDNRVNLAERQARRGTE